jgi:hypothetical protein
VFGSVWMMGERKWKELRVVERLKESERPGIIQAAWHNCVEMRDTFSFRFSTTSIVR